MILGMSLATFTLVHVVISLVAIAAGIVVLAGMLGSRRMPGWTAAFLVTTIATSVTGYFFPFEKILPSHIVGAISLVVLALAVVAYYPAALKGAWRGTYVVTAILALYLNVFVLVVQAFLKIGPLKAVAPTQQSPVFMITQGIVLVVYIWLGYKAFRAFHPEAGVLEARARS